MQSRSERLAFFRQSGWMVVATTLGGVFMWLVHIPAQAGLPRDEYGVFLALLQVINLMMIPALGLQTVMAQQGAAAITPAAREQLAFTARRLLLGTFVLWLAMTAGLALVAPDVLATLKIANPAALWATVGIGLAMLWGPVMQGLLQGSQNFLWLGGVLILNGVTRFLAVLVIVLWLGGYAAGAMSAALVAMWTAVALAAWQSRRLWLGRGAPIAWRGWLDRVVPLTLGLGTSQFMLAADQILVQSLFDKEVTGLYGAAGMIGRALVIFTGPMLAVMFPKIVESAARSRRTSVMAQALGATAILGGGAALVCTLWPELPLRLVYKREYWTAAPLVPWFAWCMLPLTLANVLIGNLLARAQFAAVPWLVVVAGAYGAALLGRADTFIACEQTAAFRLVVQTIGVFSLALLAVAVWFTWRGAANGAVNGTVHGAPERTAG